MCYPFVFFIAGILGGEYLSISVVQFSFPFQDGRRRRRIQFHLWLRLWYFRFRLRKWQTWRRRWWRTLWEKFIFCLSAEKYVKHRWYVRVFRVFDHWCHWALRMNITFQSQNTDNLSCIHCPWTRFGIFNGWEVIAVRSRHSFLIIMIRDLTLTDLQRELSDFPRIFGLWQKKSFWRFWFDLGSYIIDRVFLKTRRISS